MVELFFCQFHVDSVGKLADVQVLRLKSEVFDSVIDEGVLIADDLAMVGVDDGVRFSEKPVYPADLVKVLIPFLGVLDHNTEIDVLILRLDFPGQFLAVGSV